MVQRKICCLLDKTGSSSCQVKGCVIFTVEICVLLPGLVRWSLGKLVMTMGGRQNWLKIMCNSGLFLLVVLKLQILLSQKQYLCYKYNPNTYIFLTNQQQNI